MSPRTAAGRQMIAQLRGAHFAWEDVSEELAEATKGILAIEAEAAQKERERMEVALDSMKITAPSDLSCESIFYREGWDDARKILRDKLR